MEARWGGVRPQRLARGRATLTPPPAASMFTMNRLAASAKQQQ